MSRKKAIALEYGRNATPIVTAKAEDEMALAMIAAAREQGVRIRRWENLPLGGQCEDMGAQRGISRCGCNHVQRDFEKREYPFRHERAALFEHGQFENAPRDHREAA